MSSWELGDETVDKKASGKRPAVVFGVALKSFA